MRRNQPIISNASTASALPTAYRWPLGDTAHARLRDRVLKVTGVDLLPDEYTAQRYGELLSAGDPPAERFVAETYRGELGPEAARALLDRALEEGIDAIDDAPASMRNLFAEFDALPDWADPEQIEAGAAVWRRWAYALGGVGNAGTMDTYTEGSLAVPLSLAGGYAGERALNRYLETSRWWIEVSRPGAILRSGSLARAITMRVRVMHVSVRAGVRRHDEWDDERWGLPISQSEMMLTLLGGSVGPAMGLYGLGYITSKRELEASLMFNRYLGYLLGVRVDDIYPRTISDGLRLLYLFDATRSHDSGSAGAELVESFVPGFAPRPDAGRRDRLRAWYHLQTQSGYARLFMLPQNRRRFDLPGGWVGVGLLLAAVPARLVGEVIRRVVPGVDTRLQARSVANWERWHAWQSERPAEFAAPSELRR
ncbi:oxygenase MpaB family protein [Gordonia sp. OPL2]|uniref:oxygenase MpaB family protein n=1 Tax=Gordonia sp. OPL2 TaxID=2486274 RepID=UPI0021CC977B|nr:oxygenase MpaB family protein [Gordonia sp. OPL2]